MMIKLGIFVLSFLLFTNNIRGADPTRLTRQQSKEVALKATRIIIDEDHPILERTLERSLAHPNYKSTDLLEQREQAIEKLEDEHADAQVGEDLKAELMQWAIKELAERNHHEVSEKRRERRQKWIAAGIGLVSTILTIVIPIVFSEECEDCPSDG